MDAFTGVMFFSWSLVTTWVHGFQMAGVETVVYMRVQVHCSLRDKDTHPGTCRDRPGVVTNGVVTPIGEEAGSGGNALDCPGNLVKVLAGIQKWL